MNLKKIITSFFVGISLVVFSQETTFRANLEIKTSYLDSIKATFKNHEVASKVDSLWMKELTNTDLFDNLQQAITNINIDEKVDYELPTELLKARLKEMDAKSPFNIEYNQGLENIIKSFLKNRKKSYERLMAISEYYFPMFEEALAKENVPLEIKYLALVESALNPKAVSRVGATGLWQFMYHTGKQYNLKIDSYVDERSDPVLASSAAAKYMSNMYKIFGDWDLVLASYNSGPGNVSKAIRRSNGQQSFWNIRKHLPRETQGYVPAFLATMYIYEYHKEHGIIPNKAIIKHFETDTVLIKKQLSFKQISALLDIPVAQLQQLNPSYKNNVIPFYKDTNHFLRMPSSKVAVFASNEEKIYAYADYEANKREKYIEPKQKIIFESDTNIVVTSRIVFKKIEKTTFHKVRKGDSMSEISDKYGVSMNEIKKWNHLKNNNVPLGRNLKIITTDNKKMVVFDKKAKPVKTTNSENVVYETPKIEDISSKKITNNLDTTTIQPEYYTVKKGDNLSKIAKKYGVSETDLQKWNALEGKTVALNAKLKIMKTTAEISQIQPEVVLQNKIIHVVQPKETIWKIAKKYNVTATDIQKWNELTPDNIETGSSLFIFLTTTDQKAIEKPKKEVVVREKKEKIIKIKEYLVKKGDTLTKIAQKNPGITVQDLITWNKIKGNTLRPGMKLRING